MYRSKNQVRREGASLEIKSVRFEIEVTAEQFKQLKEWSEVTRSTPETLAVALAMDWLRMWGTNSHEENVTSTIEALRSFVDEGLSPKPAKEATHV
jgi:hypothetical protein